MVKLDDMQQASRSESPAGLGQCKWGVMCHLGDSDSRGRSREAGLAGLELADWTEGPLSETVDSSDSEPVGQTWRQFLLLSALVVLRPRELLLTGQWSTVKQYKQTRWWEKMRVKSIYESGRERKSYLFIQGAGVDARSWVVAVGRQEVVSDLREERFEHAHVKPHGFVEILRREAFMMPAGFGAC